MIICMMGGGKNLIKLSVVLRLIVSDNLYSEIERGKKEMSLDSGSLNILEDRFNRIYYDLMSEGMCENEANVRAEVEVWKWWEER